MANIFVIIPAYNEASRSQRFAPSLEHLARLPYTVVVVDDGSQDDTSGVASQWAKVLRHPINRGQGAALLTGMHYALKNGADIIVHFDADGQMQPEDIACVIAPLESNPELDVVLGSRFLKPETAQHIPWIKKYLLQLPALWFQRLTTGLKLTDVHNGFRAFRASAVGKLELQQDGMAHASEITSQIKKKKLTYQEVPVTIHYYEFGQGLAGGLRIMRDLIIRKIIK